jgi:predicted RNase H-like HicB family nuclease
MIYRIEKFTDDEGRQISAKVPMIGEEGPKQENVIELDVTIPCIKKPNVEYTGLIGVKSPMGMMTIGFEFPVGYTLEECFISFDAWAENKIKELKEQSNIVPASSVPNLSLVK